MEEFCILKIHANFKGKMNCGLINDMRNLMNVTGALENFKICALIDVFAQDVLQRSYVS